MALLSDRSMRIAMYNRLTKMELNYISRPCAERKGVIESEPVVFNNLYNIPIKVYAVLNMSTGRICAYIVEYEMYGTWREFYYNRLKWDGAELSGYYHDCSDCGNHHTFTL